MAYGLPARGQLDWDDELNNSMAAVKTTADAAANQASTAANTAASLQVEVNQVKASIDQIRTGRPGDRQVVAVYFNDVTGWPTRPWPADTGVVQWIGGTSTPPGAAAGVDFWIREPSVEDVPPGSTLTVHYDDGWPLVRPTLREDVTVIWIGGVEGNPPPSRPETSGIDLWIRSAL